MATLCIDTATDHGMVVVARDDGSRAAARWHAAGKHAENIFGFIEQALADAGASRRDLSLIGVDVGPGRFTSLRVGLATAKGLALGLRLPIVGVDALRVLARSIEGDRALLRVPVMNAYRGDVFCGAYTVDEGGIKELVAPTFGPPDVVFAGIAEAARGRQVAVCGGGVAEHADLLRELLGVELDERALRPDAADPNALVEEVLHVEAAEGPADLVMLEPRYLRPSDAKLPEPLPQR